MDGGDGRPGTGQNRKVDTDAHVTSGSVESAPLPDAGTGTTPGDGGEDMEPDLDDGIIEDVSNLVDDGITYAQAEIAFQKTRAKLGGRSAGIAAACIAVALILLHIALLALAVGLVIALQPLVTIWGAIALVVGAILAGAVLLLLKARSQASKIADLFATDKDA